MMRAPPSPPTRAAATKSFSRSESDWERKTQAGPGPAGDGQHEHEVERIPATEERGQDDEEWQAGDDEEDVGQQREEIVGAAPQVARAQSDDDADGGGEDADDQTNGEGGTRSPDGLGENVLPLTGGAEPVLGRGRLVGRSTKSVGSPGAMTGARTATKAKITRMISPATALRLREIACTQFGIVRLRRPGSGSGKI